MKPEKKPEACSNIREIRDALDKIDLEIVQLFAERHKYVKEIVKFKSGDKDIVAKERQNQVLLQRKAWAKENGLDQEFIEGVYKLLIDTNIQAQFEIYNKKEN